MSPHHIHHLRLERVPTIYVCTWQIEKKGILLCYYKIFFMLNSAEHEILNAHKYLNIKKFGFLSSVKPRMVFFPLIHVKMPTTVGILTFMSGKIFMFN